MEVDQDIENLNAVDQELEDIVHPEETCAQMPWEEDYC
jgi:hypothetical protein